jgi:prepilin-type N-terminal cleavage/methylation domain-containing protein
MNIKNIENQKGFTLIELAVSITVILVIIALASGAYFGIISKGEDADIIKMATNDLPKAIMQYKMDVGVYPNGCGSGSGRELICLNNRDKIADTTAQTRWRGPYLKPGLLFKNDGSLGVGKFLPQSGYCWTSYAGKAGQFGRVADGGYDYVVRINFYDGTNQGEAYRTANRIYEKLGSKKAVLVGTGTDISQYVDVVFNMTFD